MKRILALALTFTFLLTMTACGQTQQEYPKVDLLTNSFFSSSIDAYFLK